MYSPAGYRVDNAELIVKALEENQFATLIGPRGSITHLPLHFEAIERGERFIGHMARANPQWREFPANVTAVFHGAHGYISPAWYAPQADNVPTWNYVVVHARGQAKVIDGRDGVADALAKLVEVNERSHATGWTLAMNEDIEKLARAIVAFEIVDLKFEAKFKLSQKIDPRDRVNVIDGLRNLAVPNEDLARWMELTAPK